jgi:peptide/nickel transport system permease protein
MTKYILRRLLQSIPIFFGITFLSYALMLGTPGGPVRAIAFNSQLKPDEIKALEQKLGVNDPFIIQYLRWLIGDDWMRWDSNGDEIADGAFLINLYSDEVDEAGNPIALPPGDRYGILRGDFGNSFAEKRPALTILVERLPATLELGLISLVIGAILGILVGVVAAVRRGGWFDQTSRIGAVIISAVPGFWLSLVLLLIFGSTLKVLPLGSRCKTSLDDSCPPVHLRLQYLLLPTVVLASGTITVFSRFMRAAMLDVISQDYIRTARAKGLSPRHVWWRHGLRNAMIPIATFMGPAITLILSGAAVTESVFSWPGVGRMAVVAVGQRDFPVVMIVVIYTAAATILGFILSDILYAWIDPRIRFD